MKRITIYFILFIVILPVFSNGTIEFNYEIGDFDKILETTNDLVNDFKDVSEDYIVTNTRIINSNLAIIRKQLSNDKNFWGNVKSDSDRNHLVLTHNNEIDFINMKDLLKRGYILQVEIKTNHHFILFQKNNDEYYFLQAFYKFYQLKDWLSYDEITTIKIDNFYDNMRIITNESYDKETRHQKILEMFYPPQINKGNQDKKKEFINYFDYNPCVTIINVDYVKYNFHIKNKGKIFDMAFREVDSHFLIY